MTDPSPREQQALDYAATQAGQILDQWGGDLSAWTPEQYRAFIGAIVKAYLDEISIPF